MKCILDKYIRIKKGENLKSDRKANLLVFLTVSIVALGLSQISVAFTGDLLSSSLPGVDTNDKLIALDDDGFTPNLLQTVHEEVKVDHNETNETNETSDNSDTNITTENDNSHNDIEEKVPESNDVSESSKTQEKTESEDL